MIDESGTTMTEKQMIKEAMELTADICSLLYETETGEAHAAAFMADNLLKYLQVIYRDDNVLDAAADYTAYEEERYLKTKKHLELVT